MKMHVTAIVPAAGGGTRMEAGQPKQYLLLAGVPLLSHTLRALQAAECLDELILVVPLGHDERCRREILQPFGIAVQAVVPGGEDRQASVYAGLLHARAETDLILVHDGARPFVSPALVREAVRVAGESGGAVVAVPVTDTIKLADGDGWLLATPERGRLWAAQTPQVFPAPLFREAHARALRDGFRTTDDSALVERLNRPVRLVPGSAENLKITTAADLLLADQILRARQMAAGRAG
ncbi:MAG TPA: 2-C-methyl-D-erythritol 4-phosphate cytidylyltransferase [Candidatus Acidoferrum sp.]|nr:2-C-methyl-D-erythritol 4-phosphate cytidylyltransferase [Candidatus Acidoferrum sp.]